MSADKELTKCLKPLLELVSFDNNKIFCTEALHPRAAPKDQLQQLVHEIIINSNKSVSYNTNKHNIKNFDIKLSIENAIESVLQQQKQEEENDVKFYQPVVLICGTAFIMAEARSVVGIQEPRDYGGEVKETNSFRDAQVVVFLII